MESFINYLTQVVTNQFSEAELHVEPVPGDRVGGYMAWGGFEGVLQRQRQRDLWDYLRSAVAREDLQKVPSVLTLTPDERDAYRENADDDDD